MLIASVLFLFHVAAYAGPFRAFVSIAPQAYLVERVGGASVTVGVLVPPGQNYHTFEPTPKQLAGLAEAMIYFRLGLAFETRLLEKAGAANTGLRVVDMCKGIALRPMMEHDEHETSGALDPHVWLNPLNAKILAANVCEGLSAADPAHAAEFARNLAALEQDLDAAHERITQLLAPFKGGSFYVYHPAFGYFADAYGLKQVPVEIDGKEPTAKQLGELMTKARADRVRVILVQQQFPKKSAEAVAKEIGGAVVSVDPLAHDFLAMIEDIARKIADALKKEG